MNSLAAPGTDSEELVRLLLRMSDKDELAFKQLYAATRRKLFATALQVVKRGYLAEEVLQEAYVRIWLNAGSYRPSLGTPMAWMMTIARNQSIDLMRKSTLEVHSADSILTDVPDNSLTARETIEIERKRDDAVENIFIALLTLDPTKRHLVIAAYIHGESRDRLSERYGAPVNTIKTWIRRALLEVRANLESKAYAAATESRQGNRPG